MEINVFQCGKLWKRIFMQVNLFIQVEIDIHTPHIFYLNFSIFFCQFGLKNIINIEGHGQSIRIFYSIMIMGSNYYWH